MRGAALFKKTMAELNVDEKGFFESRRSEYVKARRRMINALHEAGLNTYEIGRLMRRDESTIRYWVDDVRRSRYSHLRKPHKLWLRAIELGPITA